MKHSVYINVLIENQACIKNKFLKHRISIEYKMNDGNEFLAYFINLLHSLRESINFSLYCWKKILNFCVFLYLVYFIFVFYVFYFVL